MIKTDDNLVCDAGHLTITEYLSGFDALIADFGYSGTIQELQVINPPPVNQPAIFWRSCFTRSRKFAASSKSSFLAASFILASS